MGTDKIIKLAMLNIGIAIFDIVLFSEGFMHIEVGGTSVFETAVGVTTMIMSVLIFAYGNYSLLSAKKARIQEREINSLEECINALKKHNIKKTFANDISIILEQTQRFSKKKQTIKEMLLQKFNSGEMSYSKFDGSVTGIETVFYMNVKSILNKLSAFDEEDYNRIRVQRAQNNFSEEFMQTKLNLYNEFITFIKDAIEDNEQILLKLDKLLLELSRFSSLEDGEIENMSAMLEIDELISKTKFYK